MRSDSQLTVKEHIFTMGVFNKKKDKGINVKVLTLANEFGMLFWSENNENEWLIFIFYQKVFPI